MDTITNLRAFAYEDKNPAYMVNLGLIYYGQQDNALVMQHPDLAPYVGSNTAEGLKLFDEAAKIANGQSPDPIWIGDYNSIIEIYGQIKSRMYSIPPTPGLFNVVERQYYFTERALNAVKASGNPERQLLEAFTSLEKSIREDFERLVDSIDRTTYVGDPKEWDYYIEGLRNMGLGGLRRRI